MSASDQISPLQFDYRSNLKNKPNAQGTLFQVPAGMRTAESRQPRGYSPERRDEVIAALGVQRKNKRGTGYGQHEHGGMSYTRYPGHIGTLAKAVSAIARSTIPLSDITPRPNEPVSQSNPSLNLGIVGQGTGKHNLGEYHAPGSGADKSQAAVWMISGGGDSGAPHVAQGAHPKWQSNMGDPLTGHQIKNIKKTPRDTEADITPIHEIGHHVDQPNFIFTPGDKWANVKEGGRREGAADKYAEQHARQPGRKSRPTFRNSTPARWHAWSEGENDSPNSQYPAYHDYGQRERFDTNYNLARHGVTHPYVSPVSGHVISSEQFHKENDDLSMGPKTYPRGHIQGQGRLLSKIGGDVIDTKYDTATGRSTRTYGPPRWDYGVT